MDLNFNGREGAEKVTYGDVYLQAEQEYSRHNFEYAGCPPRDLGDRAAELRHARARTGKSLWRRLGSHRSGQGGLMPDLLLELFSEEIPARMQAKAADDLRRMVTDKLVAEGLVYEGAKAFATPRRLALTVHGIPARQPDLKTERKGPKIGAADAAVQGFLKATRRATSISR